MGIAAGPNVARDGLALWYDFSTTSSFRGEPTTNLVPSPYDYGLYAYASGPVTVTVLNERQVGVTARRYTVTQAVNVARAAIFPSVSINTNYTFSLKWRYNGTNTATPVMVVSASKGYPEVNGSNTFNSSSTTTTGIGYGWYYTVYTFNLATSPTGATILTHGIGTDSDTAFLNNTFDIYEVQFETKAYATAYAIGTRGTTVAAGGGVIDLTGRSNNGQLVNGPTASSAFGGMVMFDGTDDHIRASSISSTTVSVAAWVRSSSWSTQTHPMIVAKGINVEWILWKSDDAGADEKFGWRSGAGATLYSTTTAQNNTWYHVMGTVGPAGMRLYVNGTLEASNGTTTVPSGSLDICVGAGVSGASVANLLSGSVRGVQVWTRQLSDIEVVQNYASLRTTTLERPDPIVTSGLVLHLDAANRDSYRGSGTTWTDMSGFGNNGTLTNGPVYRAGNGGTIVFDGVNDYVISPSANTMGSLENQTYEIWVKTPGLGVNKTIAGLVCPDYGMTSYIDGNGNVQYIIYSTDNSPYSYLVNLVTSGLNLFDDSWHHIVCTRNSSNASIYVDGTSRASTGGGGTWSGLTVWSNMNTQIGNNPNDAFYHLRGNIASVRIYRKYFTAAEVLQNYNATRSRFGL